MNLDANLEQLEAAQLVRRAEDPEQTFMFKHALTQDATYASILKTRRTELHRQVAHTYEQVYSDRLDEMAAILAQHFELADEPDQTLVYLQRAAEWARRTAAHREQVILLAHAIDLAEKTGKPELLADLHAQRGKAFAGFTRWAEAKQELRAAIDLLPADQVERRAHLLVDLAIVTNWLREIDASRLAAEEARRLADQIGHDDVATSAMSVLAMLEAIAGNVQMSITQFDQAIARGGIQSTSSFLQGMEMSGLALYWTAQLDAAIERNRQAVQLARGAFDNVTIMRGLSNLGMAFAGRGRYTEAFETLQEARAFGQTHSLGAWLARSISIEAGIHLDLFDFGRAEELALEAQERARASKFIVAMASPSIDRLFIFARTGHLSRADQVEHQLIQMLPSVTGPHVWLLALRLSQARAELALARGKFDQAIQHADETIAQTRATSRIKYQVAALETRAKALDRLGRKPEAVDDLRQAIALARPVGDPAMLLRASVALLATEGDDARAAEARRTTRQISQQLPNENMRSRFEAIISEWL